MMYLLIIRMNNSYIFFIDKLWILRYWHNIQCTELYRLYCTLNGMWVHNLQCHYSGWATGAAQETKQSLQLSLQLGLECALAGSWWVGPVVVLCLQSWQDAGLFQGWVPAWKW